MSEFLDGLDRYCARYRVRRRDRLRLLARYPYFKLMWSVQHGRGLRRRLAAALAPAVAGRRVAPHGLHTAGGERFELRVPFDPPGLQSYLEVLWEEEYAPPFPVDSAESLVDLGANTGMASLYFLVTCPRLHRAVIVEANPALVATIERTLRDPMASEREIEIVQACVSDGAEPWAEFAVHADHRHSGLDATADHVLRVTNMSLGALLDERGLERADLLKMDIEGAEHLIAAADPEVFARFRFVCAEVHGARPERDAFVACLRDVGFEIVERRHADGFDCELAFARANAAH